MRRPVLESNGLWHEVVGRHPGLAQTRCGLSVLIFSSITTAADSGEPYPGLPDVNCLACLAGEEVSPSEYMD